MPCGVVDPPARPPFCRSTSCSNDVSGSGPGANLRNTFLAVAALLLTLAGCHSYKTHPVTQTDGSHIKLPKASTKAVVWGTRPEAVQSLTTWLLKRGLILVDDIKMKQVASDIHLDRPHSLVSSADVFRLGKLLGAKQVIFIEAEVSTWQPSEIETFFGQTSTIYTASVFIRALDAETGEIHWNGKALSIDKFTDLKEGIHHLTCHALATAWGLRQPGPVRTPTICPPNLNVMVWGEPASGSTGAAKAGGR
jgi:hypothetical protein